MEFRMLGPFEAWHGEVPVDLGDLQQRYILVVLLFNVNKPVPTWRLIEIVWGANKPRTNLVPGYVAKLRRAFRDAGDDGELISTTPTGYVLRVDPAQLDTHRFTQLCDAAAEARRNGVVARATDLLHEAVELWRGRFLEDLDVDRIGGGELISLDEALIDAYGDLAELELTAGNHRWVRDRLRPHVYADPSRQRLATLLMRALVENGDRVEAMKIYHQTRDALDEFGMETSTELRGLARLAQYGEPHSTLPPRPARFTGRTEELYRIEALAEVDDRPGVIWLSGMPGVGKTALALEAAHLLRSRFVDGRLFLALNGFTPNVSPTALTEALGQLLLDLGVPPERIPPTTSGRVALYQDKLVNTRTLVVLDNVMSEDQVRPLLPESAGCLAIVTSRNAGDLDFGDDLRLTPLPTRDAADLFRALVGRDRVHGRSAQVEEVVVRCGRVPLQIKVVASQFRRHHRWPLDHLLRLLEQAGPWSTDAGFRDDGVVACMVSYQQLDEPQRTLFRLFGQIPGHDLSIAGTAALADTDLPRARGLLEELHGVSLLEEAVPERYHMLDPLKDFATTALSGPPNEAPEALARLLDFYLVTASAAIATAFPFDRAQQPAIDLRCSVSPSFDDQRSALAWLSTERANLVAAIRYAASHSHRDHTWQLAVVLWRYFNTSGHVEDWNETLELARDTVMADQTNRYGQAHVLLRLSSARWRSGQVTQALELAAEALPRWVALGDLRGEADTLCAIAVPTLEFGDHALAMSHFEAALAKYEEIDDERGQANALSVLGHLNELHGNLAVAESQQVSAVRLLRAVGHSQGLAHALDNLGSVRQRLGLLDEALANHQEAHTIAIELGDRSVEAYALNNIGNVHRLRGHLDDAAAYQERAKTVANAVSDANLRTYLYLDRGATARARGDHRAALRAYQAALDLATGTGDRGQQAHANHGIARSLHTIGDHDQAARHWRAAQKEFTNLHQPEATQLHHERAALPCACAG